LILLRTLLDDQQDVLSLVYNDNNTRATSFLYLIDHGSDNEMISTITTKTKPYELHAARVTIKYVDNAVKHVMQLVLDAPLHIIDHGSVLYLILLKILLYNQQYAYDNDNATNDNGDIKVSTSVIVTFKNYNTAFDALLYDHNNPLSFHPNDNIKITYLSTSAVMQVYSSSSSSHQSLYNNNNNSNYADDEATNTVVTMRTYDTTFELNINTVCTAIVNERYSTNIMTTTSYTSPSFSINVISFCY